jgi:hypothetical protein
MSAPLCFILASGEAVIGGLIAPAVRDVRLEPFCPAPQISPAALFEQMLLCPF